MGTYARKLRRPKIEWDIIGRVEPVEMNKATPEPGALLSGGITRKERNSVTGDAALVSVWMGLIMGRGLAAQYRAVLGATDKQRLVRDSFESLDKLQLLLAPIP